MGNYIKERTRGNAQFIIVSLRNNMFERADRLVGIYKVNDQTRSITIDPNAFNVPGGDNGERAAAGAWRRRMDGGGGGRERRT